MYGCMYVCYGVLQDCIFLIDSFLSLSLFFLLSNSSFNFFIKKKMFTNKFKSVFSLFASVSAFSFHTGFLLNSDWQKNPHG